VVVTAGRVKPRLRGVFHELGFYAALGLGTALVVTADGERARTAAAVFAGSVAFCFGASALYHRPTWRPPVRAWLARLDHAGVFLLIAGTYTPFSLLLLDRGDAEILLTLVWGGAVVGIAFRVFWLTAPRWLYLPVYIALGWSAIFWIGDFASAGGAAVVTLIIVGGALYSLGGVVYGVRRPNPLPGWFGFHEVFHSLTVAAFVVHYVGVSMATYSVR